MISDSQKTSLAQSLREARLAQGLSQQQLAERLGLGQRQISDLERAAMDPRLSTIQNVSRALDLELVLIPRHLIGAIDGLRRSTADAPGTRAMYSLGDDERADEGDIPHGEIGAEAGRTTHPTRRRGKADR